MPECQRVMEGPSRRTGPTYGRSGRTGPTYVVGGSGRTRPTYVVVHVAPESDEAHADRDQREDEHGPERRNHDGMRNDSVEIGRAIGRPESRTARERGQEQHPHSEGTGKQEPGPHSLAAERPTKRARPTILFV